MRSSPRSAAKSSVSSSRLSVSWRNDIGLFLGPRQTGLSAVNIDDQTELEIRSHRFMKTHCDFFREHAPGFENCYMLESASQLGVRHTRRLVGTGRIERSQWSQGIALADEVGVSPSVSLKFPVISVPLWLTCATQS